MTEQLYNILHMPRNKKVLPSSCSKATVEHYLAKCHIYFVKDKEIYITYFNDAFADNRFLGEEFVAQGEGYLVKPCELVIILDS